MQKRGLLMPRSKSKVAGNLNARMLYSIPRRKRENRYALLVQCLEFPMLSTYKRAYRFFFSIYRELTLVNPNANLVIIFGIQDVIGNFLLILYYES